MISSDGSVRDVYPLLSCYVADYPEQCLVACSKYGTCPKCRTKAKELGADKPAAVRTQKWTSSVLKNARKHSKTFPKQAQPRKFHEYCMQQDVAGTVLRPFWHDFPHCNIHQAITPDVLHQLYQGVFKHLVGWCQKALGPKELDERIRALPRSHGLRRFKNGISALSQISGTERKNMAKILLGCLIGVMPKDGILAVTALLDFIYIAQYEAHDDTTLGYLTDALDRYFKHRSYFIEIGIRKDFNIPKFHSLLHYVESIQWFGTTDNYNTEMFERLHIDFAKNGWRASNKRDEFPQMTSWLSRQEKLARFETYQKHTFANSESLSNSSSDISMDSEPNPNLNSPKSAVSISKHPAYPKCKISDIQAKHNAPDFDYYLKVYINRRLPTSSQIPIRDLDNHELPFDKIDVYNLFRFKPSAINDDSLDVEVVKALRKSQTHPAGQFDTVVALVNDAAESTGLEGRETQISCDL